MTDGIVTEEQVDEALEHLRKSARAIGLLTEKARKAESMLKHIKALEMKRHDGPVSAQEREAVASEAYQKALDEDAVAAGLLAEEKAYREAMAMRIEVWRTQSSNFRSMKIGT